VLSTQLEQARQHSGALQAHVDKLVADMAAANTEAAAKQYALTLSLQQTDRLKDTIGAEYDAEKRRAAELSERLAAAEQAVASAREAAAAASVNAEVRVAAAEEATRNAEAKAAQAVVEARAQAPLSASSSALGAVETGAAAHRLLGAALPDGSEGAAVPMGELTKSALYNKYVEAERLRASATADRDEATETLNALLAELHAKAPRIVEMRSQLHAVTEAHQELALRLDASAAEGAALAQRNEALELSLTTQATALESARKELQDRDLQLQLTLEECQKLKYQASNAPQHSTRRTSFGGGPTFGLAASPFSSGAPSPGLLATSNAMRTPDDVVAAHLVPFKDIADLQQKNAQLVRTVRALTQAHEAEMAQKSEETESTVSAALA
jgi:hypothetical protein